MPCYKKYFQTKREAKKWKSKLTNMFKQEYLIYKCLNCQGYHLTTHTDIRDKQEYRDKKHYFNNKN